MASSSQSGGRNWHAPNSVIAIVVFVASESGGDLPAGTFEVFRKVYLDDRQVADVAQVQGIMGGDGVQRRLKILVFPACTDQCLQGG